MQGEISDKGTLSKYKYRSKTQESVTRLILLKTKGSISQGLSSLRWKKNK